MKKAIALILTLAMSLSLAACSGGGSGSGAASNPPAASGGSSTSGTVSSGSASGAYADLEPVELTLADSAAVGAAGEIFDRLFAEKVEEITGGKMTVYLYLNGELGNDMDLLSQMQAGYIDLVGCQIAPVVSFVPEMAIFDLPWCLPSMTVRPSTRCSTATARPMAAMSAAYEKWVWSCWASSSTPPTASPLPIGSCANWRISKTSRSAPWRTATTWPSGLPSAPPPLLWPAEVFISLQNGTIDARRTQRIPAPAPTFRRSRSTWPVLTISCTPTSCP